jgi:hypothetical protein
MAFRAIAVDKQAISRTPGEALDALASPLDDDAADTLILERELRPDRCFDSPQRVRLKVLMADWRSARDAGTDLPGDERSELEALIDGEVAAATKRAAALRRELAP